MENGKRWGIKREKKGERKGGMFSIIDISFIIISERLIMSVKVAIRVRPFNQREKFLGCISCVDMRQNTTILYQNRQKNKKQHYFTFDYSLWSHDEFLVREDGYMYPATHKYVDQQKIYNLIGREILDNAWQGYNCCLFAYGQTGAGKSYSMIGYGVNRGIIPMVCEEVFQRIKKYQRKGEKQFEISLSMLEIYNEKVQDLFVSTNKRTQNGLKIRENKTLGVYVQGLTKHEVFSYADIEKRMDEGSKNRSLASTLMNEYSSRAHTIIMIEFIQKEWINKLKMNKKSSFVNLVDLAGSERVAKTGIIDNKDRLKEASNINKSLHTLGRVIEILAEQSAGKKNVQVPYRDSALTRILQNALGGNSKTIMICAISPANDNYEETLSTLRYADQTKKIKNKPIVNESAVDKIIRQLREENERLKKMLETSQENSPLNNSVNNKELMTEIEKKQMRSNVRASMREVQKEIKKNLKSFAINTEQIDEEEDSLMMTEFIDLEEPSQFFSELSFDLGNKAQVYITNLNEDQLLNYKVRYSCDKDILITNKNNKKTSKGMENFAKIVLCGLGIEENHAKITKVKDRYFIESLSESSAEYTLLNGKPVYEKRQLQHNDRIILGINSVFIFKNNLRKKEQNQKLDYEYAVNERQQEMENLSLISPTSLNLFLSNNLLRSNSKEMYGGPPTQAYNNTKKLLEQQNQSQIMDKLSEIQLEFSKLVKENEEKIREKQEFYRNKLNELKKEKEKEKEQKSTLQEKLMIKSIESQTLKTKNEELEKLKKKLSKYNEQKDRRKKYRESMLIGNDEENGTIEEDIIGEFIDLQDPNARRAQQIAIGPDQQYSQSKSRKKESPAKSNKSRGYNYEEVNIEECEDNQEVFNGSIGRQHNESLLLMDQQPEQHVKRMKNKQKQIEKAEELRILKQKNELLKKEIKTKRLFQFRRLYNIKVKCEVQIDTICTQCLKTKEMKQQAHPIDNSFLIKYLPNTMGEDAQLQEYTYKGPQKKKTISHEEMLFLEQQIIELQSKLIAKQSMNSELLSQAEDMLLNFSMERVSQGLDNRKSSLMSRRDSYGDFQLNLTQDLQFLKPKPELKIAINDFIQVLADVPSLNISVQSSLKVLPTPPPRPRLKFSRLDNFSYRPIIKEKSLEMANYDDLNIQIVFKKACKQLQLVKSEDFHYSSTSSIQKLEKHYKIQHERSSLNESLLLNDVNEQEDEVYEEQVTIRKKTQTKSKQVAKQEKPVIEAKQTIEYGINTEIPEQKQIIVCQFGINTESNEYQVNDRQKMNSFTAFLNEELEQTRQNNTEIDSHSNENIEVKQYVQVGVNCEKAIQIVKESLEVQASCETVQIDVVTEINMESYEQFRNNNEENTKEQIQQTLPEQNITQEGQKQYQQRNFENEQRQQNPNSPDNKQEPYNQEDLLQQYLEKKEEGVEENVEGHEDNEIQAYLQTTFTDRSVNTSIVEPVKPLLIDFGINSEKIKTKDQKMNTSKQEDPQLTQMAVNTSNFQVQVKENGGQNEEQIEKYLNDKQQQQQMNKYLEKRQQQERKPQENPQEIKVQKTLKEIQEQSQRNIAKFAQIIIQNKIKSLNLISHSLDHMVYQQPQSKEIEEIINVSQPNTPDLSASPINAFKDSPSALSIHEFKGQKFDIINEAINILIDSKVSTNKEEEQIIKTAVPERMRVEMIDEEVQTRIQAKRKSNNNNSADQIAIHEDSHNNSNSNDFDLVPRKIERSQTHFQHKGKQSLNNSQQLVDKFNLSFSQIAKNDMSYLQSVMGFDGLLKEEKQEELNHKIRQLEDKIKELELQNQQALPKLPKEAQEPTAQKVQEKQVKQLQTIPSQDAQQAEYENQQIKESLLALSKKEEAKNSRYIPLKKNKKKKKKTQMTEQQRKQLQIEKQIQVKIIQCNNQNIINERNLQIHKRKREAEELRKILIKKEKVELQKQLLLLIPMIRRFNLIAREMKRLIQAKISVQYRNFSHYEMIEVLKSYSANKKSGNNNIQIKIVVLNCEQGRIYTWSADVFKNRYQISQQIFEKYLESSEDIKALGLDQRNQKAKDPFWDPVDFIPQGIGYLSMQVLLYNLSYEGYISLIYKSNIIAKIYVSITPVKVKKHHEQSVEEDQSQLDYMQIFNIRSLLEKDLYFTVSIESIKFMESEERKNLDDSSQNINLTSLNSNIIKYNISYELLEMDYKLVTFTTHDVDFVADKQFKRIDYLRRHNFQNISESTLAYISDCPIKFTLNVMKDYNDEVVNASFNNEEYSEDNDHSELDKSMTSADDKNSVRSRQNSLQDVGELALKRGESKKSDFSKKPAVIYENTELINKLETDAKKEQEKRDKIKKLEESRSKHGKAEKGEKDKQCNIY